MSKINLKQQNAVVSALEKSTVGFDEFFARMGKEDITDFDNDDLKVAFNLMDKNHE